MDLPSRTTWESDIFRLPTFDFHHFFEFLDFPFSTFGFFFLSPVCPLMKPPRNQTTISPTDSDSKQPRSFLRINKVQASLPKAQLVSFKLALKTRFAPLRCVFSVCVCVCMCVCVFSVCVCVCVCVCTYPIRILYSWYPHSIHAVIVVTTSFTPKSTPNASLLATGSKPKTTWTLIHEPHGKAIFFEFLLSGTTTFSNF